MPIDNNPAVRDATVTTVPGGATVPGRPGASGAGDSRGPSGPGVSPAASGIDRVDIQPLDAAAALQILMAEVSAELGVPIPALPGDRPAFAGAPGNSTQTAHTLIRLFLEAIPETGSGATPAAWLAVVDRLEGTFKAALGRGVDTVAGWQEVSRPAVEAAHETQILVHGQLTETPMSPYWIRAEWAGLASAAQRFWRRRRAARRALSDPDLETRWPLTDEPAENLAHRSDE